MRHKCVCAHFDMHIDTHVHVFHIVPVARLEGFRALKPSKLEGFRALQPYGQIGGF